MQPLQTSNTFANTNTTNGKSGNNNNNNTSSPNNNNNNSGDMTFEIDSKRPSDDSSQIYSQQVFSTANLSGSIRFDSMSNKLMDFRITPSQISQSDIQPIIGQGLSRKTSTASECTTMSDYTPENTITSSMTSSPPIVSLCPSDSQTPDEPVTYHDLAGAMDARLFSQLSNIDTKDIDPNALLANANQVDSQHQAIAESNTSGECRYF